MKRLLIIFAFALPLLSIAQETPGLRLKGFIDTYHALQLKEPNDFLASRSRFRGEMEMLKGKSYFFASVNAVHNQVLPERTNVEFREAYMEYSGEQWAFKAGRQIIIWGKADGLQITDLVSPMDLTEFLAQDYDDIRMPVNAVLLSKMGRNWNLELLCVPLFQPSILPGEGNPWAFDLSELGLVEDEAVLPEFSASNMEYGAKLAFYFSGIDVDLSALHTWNKAPVYRYAWNDSSSTMHAIGEYHRMDVAGIGISKSIRSFVVRSEGAFKFGKEYSPSGEHHELGLIEKDNLNYLVGLDWYPGGEWTFSAQFTDEFIFDHQEEMNQNKHTYISTLSISKKLFRSTLTLSSFGYIGLDEGDFFNRTSIDYSLSDNIHVMAGLDWFSGDSGTFGRYEDNSQAWFKAKYNF